MHESSRGIAMKSIVDDINEILRKHGVQQTIDQRDITVTDKTVSDIAKPTGCLSDAIAEQLWPSVSSARVFHYTSREAAERILATGMLRLTNIEKRYHEGEIVTFCKTHGLLGYLECDSSGAPKYRTLLMPQMFYTSFTEANLRPDEEEYFWRNFAPSDGVRLTFDVEAKNPNFRRIRYEAKAGVPIPVLNDLVSTLRVQHGREFVLQGISRLCAFYLCGATYGREKEYRALYKTWPECGPQATGSGPNSYVEIPLGQMTDHGYLFRVIEVFASTRPNMPDRYPFIQRTS